MLIPWHIQLRVMPWIIAVLAGFIATVIFHQGVIQAFYLLGVTDVEAYRFDPVPPLGVPAVVSLAFWGGVWGLPLWWLVRTRRGFAYWLGGTLAGAVAPTAVAMLVVFPLKGLDVTGITILGGLVVNAAWALGVVLTLYPVRLKVEQARTEAGSDDGL